MKRFKKMPPAERGVQDTLSELLQQRADFLEGLACTRTPLLQGLDLGHDATLFGEGGRLTLCFRM